MKRSFTIVQDDKLKYLLVGLSLLLSMEILAQQTNPIEQRIEDAASTNTSDIDYSQILEEWATQGKQLNINKATREELAQSHLFNEIQINGLLQHIESSGPFININELQVVEGFSVEYIKQIASFLSCEAPLNLFNTDKSTHSLNFRLQQGLQKPRGYLLPESNLNKYAGIPYGIYTRYHGMLNKHISIGFTAKNDAGEAIIFNNKQQGFDFNTAHIAIKDVGILKRSVIGDYLVNYGQGLVIWQGFGLGKSYDALNTRRYANGIQPYKGANEFGFLRGAAASIQIQRFTIDGFFSYQGIDGNMIGKDSISSLTETGLHRSVNELSEKHNVYKTTLGGNIQYIHNRLQLGLTNVYTHLNTVLQATPKLYNQFYQSGKDVFNTSIYYSYNIKNTSLFGEIATNGNDIALLQGIITSIDATFAITTLARYYGKAYTAPYAAAFSNASSPQNEYGAYFGAQWQPYKKIVINAFVDVFYNPWLRYQIDTPAPGTDRGLQVTYNPSKNLSIQLRYRIRELPTNNYNTGAEKVHYVINKQQQNLRLHFEYKISKNITLRNRIELSRYSRPDTLTENGFMTYQDIGYTPGIKSRYSIWLRYAIFKTNSYNSRIYAYENDMPGAFYIPAYYYEGSRFYALLQIKAAKTLALWIRYGISAFDNRNNIGSGYDEINGNTKSDWKVQIRFSF